MAIKLIMPDPNSERLSWCLGVEVEICTDEGRKKGKLDFQFKILPPSELDSELHDTDKLKVFEFVKNVLVGVRGLVDEKGEGWEPEDQLEFVLRATELSRTAFNAYFKHTGSGEQRKKD